MQNTITYPQAAEVLALKLDTIKQAINRGILTRCVEPHTPASLLTEQVMLFKGKRLSLRDLTLQEAKRWEELKSIARSAQQIIDSTQLLTAVKLHMDDPTFQGQLAELLTPIVRKSLEYIINPLALSKS